MFNLKNILMSIIMCRYLDVLYFHNHRVNKSKFWEEIKDYVT